MNRVKDKAYLCNEVEPYERLINAVIIVACRDYRRALRKLVSDKWDLEALEEKESIERFFRSEWFGMLTSMDPEMLIRKLQKGVEE